MNTSLQIAGVLGPVLMALSITEYLNFKIWKDVHSTLVYLNGLVLLVGGLIIVRIHNLWLLNWAVIITFLGWVLVLLGLARMFFPTAKQASQNTASNLLLLTMLILGSFLTLKSYFL
ncbi:MAG: hypothetical protein CMO01_19085 [Thalassobius sp.]|nr:hypothetical protein [Thalassovita sp.]